MITGTIILFSLLFVLLVAAFFIYAHWLKVNLSYRRVISVIGLRTFIVADERNRQGVVHNEKYLFPCVYMSAVSKREYNQRTIYLCSSFCIEGAEEVKAYKWVCYYLKSKLGWVIDFNDNHGIIDDELEEIVEVRNYSITPKIIHKCPIYWIVEKESGICGIIEGDGIVKLPAGYRIKKEAPSSILLEHGENRSLIFCFYSGKIVYEAYYVDVAYKSPNFYANGRVIHTDAIACTMLE